jgi:uncharacterized protein YcfJ
MKHFLSSNHLPPVISCPHYSSSHCSEKKMETIETKKRIHPLMAGAAVSVMLVSIVGAAAIMGFLPKSHGTDAPVANAAPASVQPASATGTPSAPAPAPIAANKAATRHSAAPVAQHAQAAPNYSQPAQQPVQQAAQQPAAQNSYVGMATGAVIGGVLGNQVGHGNGKALATVAGAVGGGYVGNEIGKRVP